MNRERLAGELLRVAKDLVAGYTEPYVVIGNHGRGSQTVYPKSRAPELYSESKAKRIADKMNKKSNEAGAIPGRGPTHWHIKPLSDALDYIGRGQDAYGAVQDLIWELEDEQ